MIIQIYFEINKVKGQIKLILLNENRSKPIH